MIYANWLRFAVIGSALIQSEGKLHPQPQAEVSDRKLATSGVAISRFNAPTNPSSGIPGDTCLTEAHCNAKRQKLGIEDRFYYVSEGPNVFPAYGCFRKNNKAYWGQGGTAAEKAKDDLSGIKERIWCDGWNDDGHKPGKSSTRIYSYFYCGFIIPSSTKYVDSISCIHFPSRFVNAQSNIGAMSSTYI